MSDTEEEMPMEGSEGSDWDIDMEDTVDSDGSTLVNSDALSTHSDEFSASDNCEVNAAFIDGSLLDVENSSDMDGAWDGSVQNHMDLVCGIVA